MKKLMIKSISLPMIGFLAFFTVTFVFYFLYLLGLDTPEKYVPIITATVALYTPFGAWKIAQEWRKQKKFDMNSQLLSNMHNALYEIEIYLEQTQELLENLQKIKDFIIKNEFFEIDGKNICISDIKNYLSADINILDVPELIFFKKAKRNFLLKLNLYEDSISKCIFFKEDVTLLQYFTKKNNRIESINKKLTGIFKGYEKLKIIKSSDVVYFLKDMDSILKDKYSKENEIIFINKVIKEIEEIQNILRKCSK